MDESISACDIMLMYSYYSLTRDVPTVIPSIKPGSVFTYVLD